MRILIRQGAGPLEAYQAMHEARMQRARLELHEQPAVTTTDATDADAQLWNMTQDPSGLLRGIPAIGRGVTGAIRDTRPEDAIR